MSKKKKRNKELKSIQNAIEGYRQEFVQLADAIKNKDLFRIKDILSRPEITINIED